MAQVTFLAYFSWACLSICTIYDAEVDLSFVPLAPRLWKDGMVGSLVLIFEDQVVDNEMLPPLPLPPPPLLPPPLPPTLTMVGRGVAFTVNGWEGVGGIWPASPRVPTMFRLLFPCYLAAGTPTSTAVCCSICCCC
jgi:hypothetical protein